MEIGADEGVRPALERMLATRRDVALIEAIRAGPAHRNAVWRVSTADGPAVLKLSRVGSLAIERAALAVLDGRHAPALLDGGEGWLLAQDLGPTDPVAGPAALAAIGGAIGAVHSATLGFTWEQPPVDVDHAIFRWPRALAALPNHLAAADVRATTGSIRDLRRTEQLLSRPGAGRVLANGDLGPMNAVFREGRAILVDWEVAGPRHPALDFYPAVQPVLRASPSPVSDAEEDAFARGYREAGGHVDSEGIAAAAIAWAAVAAITIPLRLERDAIQGTVGHRARIVAALAEASRRSSRVFPAIARDLGRASEALARRWRAGLGGAPARHGEG